MEQEAQGSRPIVLQLGFFFCSQNIKSAGVLQLVPEIGTPFILIGRTQLMPVSDHIRIDLKLRDAGMQNHGYRIHDGHGPACKCSKLL